MVLNEGFEAIPWCHKKNDSRVVSQPEERLPPIP